MKNIIKIFVLISFFSNYNCFSQNNECVCLNNDTYPLYPPSNVVVLHHNQWTKTHYNERIAEFQATPLEYGDIVFIGNSITEQGGDWGQRFNNPIIKNRGISGDVTAGVITRLKEIYHYTPSKVFIKIGINDLFRNDLTPEYVARNIQAIANKINLKSPNTKIYIQTILPTSQDTSLKNKIATTNSFLLNIPQTDYIKVLDLHSVFANSNDLMISSYTTDGTHLNAQGYLVWKNFIQEFVNN